MERCKYLMQSEEAFWIHHQTNQRTTATVYLCDWVEQNPERLVDAPIWLLKRAGGSAVSPEHDCPKCSAYQTVQP